MITTVFTKQTPVTTQIDENGDNLEYKLSVLHSAYTKLEIEINLAYKKRPVNQIQIIRLEKILLNLKDQIEKIHSKIYPDIIA